MEQLRTKRIATEVLAEMESAEAANSGCGQSHGDMVWATGVLGGGGGKPGPLAADDAAVTLCVYRVVAEERGSEKPRGDFVSGAELARGRWVQVKAALAAAPAARSCNTPATRFVLLKAPQGEVYVELDGCRRSRRRS